MDVKWFSVIIEQLLSNAVQYTENGSTVLFIFSARRMSCVLKTQEWVLYLANEIAEKLGLRLSVESAVGAGTKMFLLLSLELSRMKRRKLGCC